uniref:EXPERA domain-containing protein n=1 Tax=Oryza rufipogon TaxID=4529 RepID=A0A0E0MQA0_ORYRU
MGHPHPHPYAPAELHLPGFVPLQLSQAQILVPYLATSLFLLLAVWLISGRCSRRLSDTDRWLMCWWAFTGLTHIIIEGTFVFAPNFFSNQNPSYFDEVWKEYSKGDSRYVARDPATVTVEGITAVLEGPASLLAVGDSLPLPPSPLPYLMHGSRQKCRDREEEVEDGGVASSHSVAPRGKLLSCSAQRKRMRVVPQPRRHPSSPSRFLSLRWLAPELSAGCLNLMRNAVRLGWSGGLDLATVGMRSRLRRRWGIGGRCGSWDDKGVWSGGGARKGEEGSCFGRWGGRRGYAIASGKSYSHILQFTVCLGQLYGCLVYFITAYLDGFNFWTSPFYFWAYFIGANSSWVVIPTMIAIRSWKKICAAFQVEKVKTK